MHQRRSLPPPNWKFESTLLLWSSAWVEFRSSKAITVQYILLCTYIYIYDIDTYIDCHVYSLLMFIMIYLYIVIECYWFVFLWCTYVVASTVAGNVPVSQTSLPSSGDSLSNPVLIMTQCDRRQVQQFKHQGVLPFQGTRDPRLTTSHIISFNHCSFV